MQRLAFARGLALLLVSAVLLAACHTLLPRPPTDPAPATKLVVLITVDQLRGDLPMRYRDRLGPGGFRYLLEEGVHYTNAHYRHANTETAVGHATLATGADPSAHGIVGNDWVDATTGAFVYNTEDDRHRVLGAASRPHQGVSPRQLRSSTLGDELVLASGGHARVFSVSGKDRGAILPGGHAGKAFWYSKGSGRFVTSSYYYDVYPGWVEAWNAAAPAERYRGASWELLLDPGSYLARERDDRPYEADALGMGRTFPHPYPDDRYHTVRVGLTPAVDDLTLSFVEALMRAERPGHGPATDLLAVSFSATDYAGHLFGPASLESEDVILRLDRLLARLFALIEREVGLPNALIVLCADHGAPEAPEYAAEQGIAAGRFAFDHFKGEGSSLRRASVERFGFDPIADHSHPYLYLDEIAVRRSGLELAQVERFVAEEASREPGVFDALTRSDLLAGRVANAPVQEKIRRNFSPGRSGHVHLVQEPYWFLHSTDEASQMGLEGLAAIHGSPWAYDTYVPIFFAGAGIGPRTVSRRVAPTDIAATLAAHLGIKYPSGSVGTPLPEVLDALAGRKSATH